MFGVVNGNEEKLGISAKHAQGTDGFHACPLRIREGLAEKTNDVFARTGYGQNEWIGRFPAYAVQRRVIAASRQEAQSD